MTTQKHESTGTIEIFLSKSYELGKQEKKSSNSKCSAEILLSLTSPSKYCYVVTHLVEEIYRKTKRITSFSG